MWSTQEGKDGHDIAEWIAQQPHLKAIFVSHVCSDFYREMVYMGGVLSQFLYGLWDGRHGTSGFAPKNPVSHNDEDSAQRRTRTEATGVA